MLPISWSKFVQSLLTDNQAETVTDWFRSMFPSLPIIPETVIESPGLDEVGPLTSSKYMLAFGTL